MGKTGSKQKKNRTKEEEEEASSQRVDNMEKKAKRSTENQEEEEAQVMLWDIDEKERLKIAVKMQGLHDMVIKGRNRGKTIWEVFANELIKEGTEELKSVIIQTVKESGQQNDASLLWLDEIRDLKPEMELEEMKEIAQSLKREDVKGILETMILEKKWEKGWTSFKLKYLSRNEKDLLAEKLKTILGPDWILGPNWRDLADKMGYTNDEIIAIAEKAKPAMKLIIYLSRYHPYTTLKEMENLCRNQMGTNELAQTISEIRKANIRYQDPYEKTEYNGSPDPRKDFL